MALTQEEFFDDDFDFDFGDLASQVQGIGEELFPGERLSEQELAEYNRLLNRAQRLSPINLQTPVGNTMIPGNPFSTDVSPIIRGAQQGLQAIINAERQRRQMAPTGEGRALAQGADAIRERAKEIGGERGRQLMQEADVVDRAADATSLQSRLRSLSMKQQLGQQAEEQRNAFFAKLFPDLAGREMQRRKELDVTEERGRQKRMSMLEKFGYDKLLLDEEAQDELASQAQEFENLKEEIQMRAALGQYDGAGGRGAQFADANDMRQIVNSKIRALQEQRTNVKGDFSLTPDEKAEAVAQIDNQINGLLDNTMLNLLVGMGFGQEDAKKFIAGDEAILSESLGEGFEEVRQNKTATDSTGSGGPDLSNFDFNNLGGNDN